MARPRAARRGLLVRVATTGPWARPSDVARVVAALPADVDLLLVAPGAPFRAGGAEPFSALGGARAPTRLALGGVVGLGEGRSPSIAAKLASSLAFVSGAPVVVVVEPDPAAKDPAALLEALEVLGALRRPGPVSVAGRTYALRDATNEPLAFYRVGVLLPARVAPALVDAVASRVELVLSEAPLAPRPSGPEVRRIVHEAAAWAAATVLDSHDATVPALLEALGAPRGRGAANGAGSPS